MAMRGITAVGFLVAFAVVAVLAVKGMQSETTSAPAPAQAIDKANEAAQTLEHQTGDLQKSLNQQP